MTGTATRGEPGTVAHVCPYPEPVLERIAPLLDQHHPGHVHDPFAGDGRRLGQLCDARNIGFTGGDLEPEHVHDPRVRIGADGDALNPAGYPTAPFMLVCSPSFACGTSDPYVPKVRPDGTIAGGVRYTYAGRLLRPLHPHNTGGMQTRREADPLDWNLPYWTFHDRIVQTWAASAATLLVVDMKNFKRRERTASGGRTIVEFDVCSRWVELVERHGFALHERHLVPVTGNGHAAKTGRGTKVEHHEVLVFTRNPTSVQEETP